MNIEGRCYTQTDCFTCITPYMCFEVPKSFFNKIITRLGYYVNPPSYYSQ